MPSLGPAAVCPEPRARARAGEWGSEEQTPRPRQGGRGWTPPSHLSRMAQARLTGSPARTSSKVFTDESPCFIRHLCHPGRQDHRVRDKMGPKALRQAEQGVWVGWGKESFSLRILYKKFKNVCLLYIL